MPDLQTIERCKVEHVHSDVCAPIQLLSKDFAHSPRLPLDPLVSLCLPLRLLRQIDGDEVPVPHAGLAMTVENFHLFANRLRENGVKFVIEPHLRFKVGGASEHWCFLKHIFKDSLRST